jgi:hypothetical protein
LSAPPIDQSGCAAAPTSSAGGSSESRACAATGPGGILGRRGEP